ncbi:MAG: hypothetical protein H6631_17620 [Anaerolineaceae bacterium]|nr:hypothetical protein [Anaerolineaceae bacterium]MCB9102029.1 hypothetical protein [Anaerolineales bacterium]
MIVSKVGQIVKQSEWRRSTGVSGIGADSTGIAAPAHACQSNGSAGGGC